MNKFIIAFLFLFFGLNQIEAQFNPTSNILYVKKGANGNGSSWTNAVGELADALKWAHENRANFTTTPLQIWVAGGTYKPKYSPADSDFGTNRGRNNSFLMVKNVKLYGGFAGAETDLNQRDFKNNTNETILSGDLNGTNIGNSYHVVITDDSVVIDGFTITKGNADGTASIIVNGKTVSADSGAGICSESDTASSITLINSKVNNNIATYGGGLYYSTPNSSSVILINSKVNNNIAYIGSGLYLFSNFSTVVLANSEVNNNTADIGSGIYLFSTNFSAVTLINSNIISNKGIHTIFYNGGGFDNRLTIHNSIVYNNLNKDGTPYTEPNLWLDGMKPIGSNFNYKNSLIQGNVTISDGNISSIGLSMATLFTNANLNDYSLAPNSPLINKGSNSLYTGYNLNINSDKDLAGNPRLIQNTIDIGSYEYQCFLVLSSTQNNVSCTGENNGSATVIVSGGTAPYNYSWSPSVGSSAIASGLAAGTYTVTVTDAKGCIGTLTFTITEPAIPSAPSVTSQTFCGSATVGDLPQNSGTYQWYVAATGGTALASTTNLTSGTYYVSNTASGCESTRAAVTVTITTIPSAPSVTSQTFCGSATVGDLPQNSGTYQWYVAATGGTALASTTNLTSGTYYVSSTASGCESPRAAVTVTITTIPSAPSVTSQTFCGSATVGDLPQNSGTYQWYVAATGGTALASTTNLTSGTYYVSNTASGCESPRAAVTVTITTIPSAPSVTSQTFCGSATVGDLPQNSGTYQWYVAATGGTALASTTNLTSGTYYVSNTASGCESTRAAVTVTITTIPSAPSVTSQTFCGSATVGDLPQNSGTYQWYVAATGGTALASTTNLTSGTYYVSSTASGCESTRAAVTVTITTIPSAPSVTSQTFCGSATVGDLPQNSGTYQWYVAATGGTALASTTNLTSGTYYVSNTASGCESTRAAVTVTITTIPSVPSVTSQTFCGSATVGDLPQNSGTYQWYVAATGGTALASTTNLTSGTYYVSNTASGCESTRAAVTVTITTIPSAPSVTSQTFCGSATVGDLPQNSGTYQWYVAATGGTALASTTNLTSGTYYVSSTASGCESPRAAVTVTITTIPSAPSVTSKTFCGSATVGDLPQGNGTYKWYSAATGGTALASTTNLTSGTYYVSNTASGCESTRAAVTVTITTIPSAPSVTSQTFCGSATVGDLPQNSGTYQWYVAATGGTALASTTNLTSGTYYVSSTASGCESTRAAVTVTITTIPSAPSVTSQTFCGSATVGDLPQNSGTYQWYVAATGGTALASTTNLTSGTYYVSNTASGCESTRAAVTVTITTIPSAPSVTSQTFCGSATVGDLPQNSGTYQWYVAATGGTALASTTNLTSGTYYVSNTASGCESTRAAVTVTITTIPSAPSVTSKTFCGSATVGDLPQNSGTYQWYVAATGGTALASTTNLTSGTYYVSSTASGCESPRAAVTVTITTIPSAPSVTSKTFCGSATVGDLPQGNGTYQWYVAATGGTALASTTNLTSGTYYVSSTASGCESPRAAVTVTITTIPSAPSVTSQTFCGSATVGDLPQNSGTYQWYVAATGGTALASTTNLTSGTYYVSNTASGCESTRAAVTVTITTIPSAPSVTSQTFCGSATVGDLPQNSGTYQWYVAATGGTALASTTNLTSGTYYVSNTASGCESARAAVTVTITTIPSAPSVTSKTFCGSATVGDLPQNSGTYQWYVAATGGTALASTTNLTSGTYYVSSTASGCESPRAAVTVTITTIPSAPSVTSQTFCGSATVGDLPQNSGTYQWYVAATGGTALASTTNLTSGTYYVSNTASGCESTRAAVTVTITTIPSAPSVTSQTFCGSATVGDLPQNSGTYQWYVAATGGTALASTTNLTSGTYYVSNTASGCESPRAAVTVTITTIPSAPSVTSQTFCGSATVGDLPQNSGTYQWYVAATGGTALASTTNLTSGTYYVSNTASGCESTRAAVTVTITTIPSAPSVTSQTFCGSATVGDLPQNSGTYQWYVAATGGTALASTTNLTSGTYYVSNTASGCESPRAAVTVTITTIPSAPSVTSQTFCGSATVGDLPQNSGTYQWYVAATGGTALASTTNLTSGTYYVSNTASGCESARAAVTVTITTIPSAPSVTSQTFCGSATVGDLPQGNGTYQWYSAATGGTALASTTHLTSGTYYVSSTASGCESVRSQIQIAVYAELERPIAGTHNICGSGTVADLVATGAVAGAVYNWYNSATSTTPLALNTPLVNGIYYVSQSVSGCESKRRSVTVRVIIQTAPVVNSFALCGSGTISDLYLPTATFVSYKWYATATSTVELTQNVAVTTGTYYVSRIEYGCASQRTAVAVTILDLPSAPTGATTQSFTVNTIGQATIADLVMDQVNVVWYITALDAKNGNNPLPPVAPLVSGQTYYAVIIGTNGCPSLPTAVTVHITLGVDDFDKTNLVYYPNPTTDILNIRYKNIIDEVVVYNLLGQKVLTQSYDTNEVQLDMSRLASGNYLLELHSENHIQIIKIVKK